MSQKKKKTIYLFYYYNKDNVLIQLQPKTKTTTNGRDEDLPSSSAVSNTMNNSGSSNTDVSSTESDQLSDLPPNWKTWMESSHIR